MSKVVFHEIILRSLVIVILFQMTPVFGQIQVTPITQPTEIMRYDSFHSTMEPKNSSSFHNTLIQRQNESIMREVDEYECRRIAINNNQSAIQDYIETNLIPLPDFSLVSGVECFYSARKEILEMLEGKRDMSLKRAVFVTENAFFKNKMEYSQFDAAIQNLKHICLLKMQEEKLYQNDELAKLMMIFRVMTEIVVVKEHGSEKKVVHYPMKYDFEDYSADINTSNYMVSKLLNQNTGQCHSMPLLFLILAEELGAKAFWCFSPSHSFVKFSDKQNRWYNIELTQGAIVTDDFYMNSGFIKSKAIQTGIYLNPRTLEQTIAHLLNDLSFYYISRYDYDNFVKENSDIVLHYSPSDLTAYQHYASMCTAQALYIINAYGRPPKEQLSKYPQAYSLFKQMQRSYEKIDSLGYEEMPLEMYHNWLKQLDKAKTLPENQSSPIIQIKK